MFKYSSVMTNSLRNKHVLLGVSGGIAAYKTAELVRLLIKDGAKVRVVMTMSAKAFITPLTLEVLSGEKVRDSLFDRDAEASMSHIELSRWADIVLIAPATANTIESLVSGRADDLLSTLCLATPAPVVMCPAMNKHMWSHPATKENVRILRERGIGIIGPTEGEQACGDVGLGRMTEVVDILAELRHYFLPVCLEGCNVLITAGPTREAIDPVRYISNHSSGKMGYALAEAARSAGAQVTLISGPTALEKPPGLACIDVESAKEMLEAVQVALVDTHVFIGCAAVCDFYYSDVSSEKIKKTDDGLTLYLNKAPDIVKTVASMDHPPFVVGFAAETSNVEDNAIKKLNEKCLHMVVGNEVGKKDVGFNSDENECVVFSKTDKTVFAKMKKNQLARELITHIAMHYKERKDNGT